MSISFDERGFSILCYHGKPADFLEVVSTRISHIIHKQPLSEVVIVKKICVPRFMPEIVLSDFSDQESNQNFMSTMSSPMKGCLTHTFSEVGINCNAHMGFYNSHMCAFNGHENCHSPNILVSIFQIRVSGLIKSSFSLLSPWCPASNSHAVKYCTFLCAPDVNLVSRALMSALVPSISHSLWGRSFTNVLRTGSCPPHHWLELQYPFETSFPSMAYSD